MTGEEEGQEQEQKEEEEVEEGEEGKEEEEAQPEELTEEDDTGEDIDEEQSPPAPKRRRRRQAAASALGASGRRTSKSRADVPSGRSTRTPADHALVPCIQLTTPIPLQLLSRGLTACMRSAPRESEPAQAALFDALYGIRMEQKEEEEVEEGEEGKEEEEEQPEELTEEDDTGEDIDEEQSPPAPKRRRRRQAAASALGASGRRTSKSRADVPSGRSTRTPADHALVPCIQLTTPIPLQLLSRGLTACMRSAPRESEPAQAALFDALYGIRMELEDRISDGHKMDITYYKQAKRNEERQATALLARKLERPRAAQVLGALLEKWNETMVSPTR